MRLLILIGVTVFTSELSNVHAGEDENKPQDFTGVYHPPVVYAPGNPALLPVYQPGVPAYVATQSANSYPNGPQGSHDEFGHQPNHGNPNGNGGSWNNGPVPDGDHDHPQINLPYDPVNSHYESQKEECYDKSCEVEFHGYPPRECGRYPWNIAKCDYFVMIRRDHKKNIAKFTLSTILDVSSQRRGESLKQGYIAVGISEDDKMGADDVVECVLSPRGALVYHSYIDERRTTPIRQKDDIEVIKVLDIKQVSLSNQKVNLTCIFERPIAKSVHYYIEGKGDFDKYVDLNKGKFHVLLARGQLKGPIYNELGQHDPVSKGGSYASSSRYNAKFWSSGCHKQRPSNMLIASIILVIVFILPPFRK